MYIPHVVRVAQCMSLRRHACSLEASHHYYEGRREGILMNKGYDSLAAPEYVDQSPWVPFVDHPYAHVYVLNER